MKGRSSSGGPIMEPPEDDAPTYAELGVDKKRAARAQRIAAIPKAGAGHMMRTKVIGRNQP
jgi:hypothetical protein